MARTSDPNSATNQFFINVNDNSRLNFRSPDPSGIGYTVFGKVTAGMDVVNKIAKAPKGGGKPVPPGTPVDPRDVPSEPIVITSAKIIDSAK
jgi:cyclophilin family peptidyl-prolyl cis-trans isomerase